MGPKGTGVWSWIVVLAFAANAWGALSADDRRRIEDLKQNPERIAEALRTPETDVARYFHEARTNPSRMRALLGSTQEPEPFRRYLLTQLDSLLRTGSLPHEGATAEDYLLALFAAFRDTNVASTVRPHAYRVWARDVLPNIAPTVRNAALASLRQRILQADQRMDAVPALLLAETPERMVTLLNGSVRSDTNAAVRRRAMEALNRVIGRTSPVGRTQSVQLAVIPFLRDADPQVRTHAQEFLADLTETKARTRQLLSPSATQELLAIVNDGKAAVACRIAAVEVLAGDLFEDFSRKHVAVQQRPVYQALAALLVVEHPALRRAAAQAFARIKPLDADAMVALVRAGFGEDPVVSAYAFSALGSTTGQDNESRILRLPGTGNELVLAEILNRMELVLGAVGGDPDGSRRRHGAELVRRNPPRNGDAISRVANLVVNFPKSDHADDVYARNTLLSALIVAAPADVDFESIDEPAVALRRLVASVASLPPDEQQQIEPIVLAMRPTAEAVLEALRTTTGNQRLLVLRQVAGYSGGRIQRLCRFDGGDEVLASMFDDPVTGRILLHALARNKEAVTLRYSPRILARVLEAARRVDADAPSPDVALHRNAATVLQAIGTVKGRHQAFGDGLDARDLRRAALLLADDAEAPEASQRAARAIRERLEGRRGGAARCQADLANEGQEATGDEA